MCQQRPNVVITFKIIQTILLKHLQVTSFIKLNIACLILLVPQMLLKTTLYKVTSKQTNLLVNKNRAYLVTVVTLIGLLSTMSPLMSLHVVFLDKPHPTFITAKRLFT